MTPGYALFAVALNPLDVERPCYPATTHRYRRVGQSNILCCVRCGQGKQDIVGIPPLDCHHASLVAAARALTDWYDGPPYVYVEGEMEQRIDALRAALEEKP